MSPRPDHTAASLECPWAESFESVADALAVDPEQGLDRAEVRGRRARHGPNALRRTEARNWGLILVAQLKSLIVVLLAVGAGLSFAFQHTVEGVSILVVIALNTAIGFFTELRAVRSMEALRKLGTVQATVRRNGQAVQVAAVDLVPGDIVLVEGGDVATADVRLTEASRLQVDESALTGESVPVYKRTEALSPETILAERTNMLFKGTATTRGAGEGIVVGTGLHTELGRITELVEQATDDETPLEKRLEALGRRLLWASLSFVVLIAGVGVASGRPLVLMLETAIALAVATVPEGLPIVATLALARGMWRMARRNALIEELAAVETLGSTNVILTDKTGTLTENQMRVSRVEIDGAAFEHDELASHGSVVLDDLLTAAALCTDAEIGEEDGEARGVGDPMEVALLFAARSAGLTAAALRRRLPEIGEEAFDPAVKMMATYHAHDDEVFVAVKGAPESVLPVCVRIRTAEGTRPLSDDEREHWHRRASALGERGLRVLVVASKIEADRSPPPYASLEFLGLVALQDPPRKAIRDVVARCTGAGVGVAMVTGDQSATASSVARAVSILKEDESPEIPLGSELDGDIDPKRLLEAKVIARASPEQKLKLLRHHQQAGNVVAMIGDGVNDAPALKQADIGVAMGGRGTQIAREAADMVLQDDDFATIAVAIAQGRVIFGNIRKFVIYLISCNLGEILVIGLASLVQAPLPVLPMQILFLNLVTDVFPALALGAGEGSGLEMQRPPRRPDAPLLSTRDWWRLAGFSVILTVPVLAAQGVAILGLDLDPTRAVTVSFLTLAFSQLVHVFNMADSRSSFFDSEVTRNRLVWGAVALCTVLLIVAVYLPGLSDVLGVKDPGPYGWAVVASFSLFPLLGRPFARLTAQHRAP